MKIILLNSLRDTSKVSWDFIYPIYRASRELRALGYDVEIRRDVSESLADCDVLGVLSSWLRYESGDEAKVSKVSSILKRHPKGCFFDIGDSTGLLYRRFFDDCRFYVKKQVYKDRSLYKSEFQDSRLHLDHYMKKHGLQGTGRMRGDLDFEKISRMRVSWNVGVGDYRSFRYAATRIDPKLMLAQLTILNRAISLPGFSDRYDDRAFSGRDIDLLSLFSSYKGISEALYYHRKATSDRVAAMKKESRFEKLKIVDGFLSPAEYQDSLSRSKCGVAPFGWGEISWKDFEFFQKGIALVKPDMAFMETWPNYYEAGVTYVSYDWDAEDLGERLAESLAVSGRLEEIARAGTERFKQFNPALNAGRFAGRFDALMKDILSSNQ